MSLKPSIWQIVNPFFLQDWQDANPSAVSYPLNVADWVKGWSSAVDPLSLDIAGLPAGTLATTTELAINNGAVNEKTTLSDLATFLGGGGTPSDLAVKVATTAVLPWTPTYDNGTSGVGATLTRSSNGTTGAIDGVAAASLVAGDYILVKNQAAQLQNGVYEITQQGTASLPYILTRVTEADTSAELDDLVVTAALGTTNKGIPYGQQTNNPIIGTNNIVFTATGIYMRQQTSGTQAINQIPVYTATGLTQTKGTANFKYNPANDLFTIRGIDYTFPANNGDASQVLTTDGAGNLSWATGGGGSPAGSDTWIQYNNAGAFGADAGFFKGDETFGLGLLQTQQSAVTFTGSGLNDLIKTGTFSGTYPTTYTVTVNSINLQTIPYNNLVGGTFTVGNTVSGSISGATGTILSDDGVGSMVVQLPPTPTEFIDGDVIDNGFGVTADASKPDGRYDTFDWTDGTNSGTDVSMSTSPISLSNGLDIVFSSITGHKVADSWTWTYSKVQNNILDFSNGTYKFGTDFGTDYFGYEVGKNILGFGLKGSLNTWFNGFDLAINGIYDASGSKRITSMLQVGADIISSELDINTGIQDNVSVSGNFGTRTIKSTEFTYSNTVSGIEHGISQSAGVVTTGNLSGGNGTAITIDDVNEHITISNLPAYDDDTAAGVGGLTAGMVYMTTGSGSAPLNAAGILMIKQ